MKPCSRSTRTSDRGRGTGTQSPGCKGCAPSGVRDVWAERGGLGRQPAPPGLLRDADQARAAGSDPGPSRVSTSRPREPRAARVRATRGPTAPAAAGVRTDARTGRGRRRRPRSHFPDGTDGPSFPGGRGLSTACPRPPHADTPTWPGADGDAQQGHNQPPVRTGSGGRRHALNARCVYLPVGCIKKRERVT